MSRESNSSNFNKIIHKYFKKEYLILIPNILCFFRILLVPVCMTLYLVPISILGNSMAGTYLAVGLLMLAAYTDFIDGFIARTFNQKSDLGMILDHIADKFLQLSMAISALVKFYMFPSVIIMFVIFLAKEGLLFFETLFLARRNKTYGGAKWYGKVSSFIFYCVVAFILLGGPFMIRMFPVDGPLATAETIRNAHLIFETTSAFASLWLVISMVLYFILYFKIRNNGKIEVVDTTENLIKEDSKND